jgi:hypothetical protein
MPTPNEKLAGSLEELKLLQEKGIKAIKSTMLSRVHKDRLIKNGYIKEVTKGWYISSSPNEKTGETGSWYMAYWEFCAEYLNATYRNPDEYFLHPDHSISLYVGNRTVPAQLIIRTTKKMNHNTPLLFGTSIWHWESPPPKASEFEFLNGIRVMTLASSLVYCSSGMFISSPTDMRAALAMISDSSEVLRLLLDGGHTQIAGRLAGAFKNIGREKIADDIVKAMRAADYDVRETDPFETPAPFLFSSREKSPYVNRIKLMWHTMREAVVDVFPEAPGLPEDHEQYMKMVEDIYVTDAYHSLSIERYVVTPELIERVRSGTWDIHENEEDKKQKNAMAARGYWQATQKVRESIVKILKGNNPGKVVDNDHGDWYRELFGPSITAGILKPSDLAGYRNDQVYIGGSKHVPLNVEALRDTMPTLFELLEEEKEASVRAVLGHFIFVFIHPYKDGNGRMGRFLMNVMLASGGYPWTVIPVEKRNTYMEVLEKASVDQDIRPFVEYIAYLVTEGLNGRPVARLE